MPDAPNRLFVVKRLLIAATALVAFMMASVIGSRLAVESLFKGIATSKATGLAGLAPWDSGRMLQKSAVSFDKFLPLSTGESWIARSAEMRTHSSDFDRSVATLHQLVAIRHGYLEDLRTESRSGFGRALSASVSVPCGMLSPSRRTSHKPMKPWSKPSASTLVWSRPWCAQSFALR
jgi:hypothetical protein